MVASLNFVQIVNLLSPYFTAGEKYLNILVISNVSSGLYNFRAELLERLRQDAILFVTAEDNGKREKIEDLGVRFIESNVSRRGINPFQDLKLLRFYKNLIEQLKPDVVLTYTIKPNVYGGLACVSLGVPYIANVTGLGTAIERKSILQKICLFLYKRGLRKAKKVFFQNQDNLDFMLGHKIVRDNYDLLPGSGVNLRRFSPSEYPTSDELNFVFVGRIMKDKGVEEYFEAARYLRSRCPLVRFHVYGYYEQGYRDIVERLHDENVIIYHGVADDMPSVYRAAHCVVVPSYHEGMCNVLQEACACARPIITTDRPGCKELVEDGWNGFSVKAEDSSDLIRAMEVFINLPTSDKARLGLNGRKYVEAHFDREIVVQKYVEEIYGVQ